MLHKHKCEDCLHVFQHEVPNTRGMSDAAAEKFYSEGHFCPRCGSSGPDGQGWRQRYYASNADRAVGEEKHKVELIDQLIKAAFGGDRAAQALVSILITTV
jgi:rubredoxin